MDELIDEIFAKHTAYPPIDRSRIIEFEKETGYALPADLKHFYARCNGAILFGDEQAYSCAILPIEDIKRTRFYIFGEEGDNNEMAPGSWYAICDVMDGNYIGIDLASIGADNTTCSIIDCFHETHGMPGDNWIIAQSFTEFLRRTLNGGGEPYWLQQGFKGYGEALEVKRR